MTKPSERIVVFVTTAQKRAITATAEDLGISVSELMRRAVLSFGATSEQVKAASIVDRLRAPRAPDALNAALQRVARGTRHARATLPATLQARDADAANPSSDNPASPDAAAHANPTHVSGAKASAEPAHPDGSDHAAQSPLAGHTLTPSPASAHGAPLLPAGVAAALAAEQDEQAAATAEAVARLTAARAAEGTVDGAEADAAVAQAQPDPPVRLRNSLKRRRTDKVPDDDEPHGDPSTEGGHFA
ncbi:hypothetical protein [Paraburkholderia antibiotica]|uniref:Uncharacterized protein n=1 Tax=Paraburkholderia antibiotica TaxID=2728839 RepID=A0A7X9ZWK5_9BURK|nr:hypothetical protein [Paraburkholderia antibiotica]NML31057.1 hypothetical protein [Paraburkholderia antibiotica]